MNKNNFLMAALLAGGVFFSACTDKSVATTDQNTDDAGTTAEQYPADDAQTTTTDETDTGIAGAEMEQEGDVAVETEVEREDVAATGEELEMEQMGATGMDDAAMANMPAATQQLLMPVMDMMNQMNSQEMSGNIDQDFARLMIIHHQGAINLSDQVLQSGDNQEILERARQVSQTKQQEIEQLQAFADQQMDASGADTAQMDNTGSTGDGQLKAATEDTLEALQNEELNGDPDHDYAHLLILHHQDAVEMAEMLLQNGQNEELKAIAQSIVDNNQQEISELETWVSNNDQ